MRELEPRSGGLYGPTISPDRDWPVRSNSLYSLVVSEEKRREERSELMILGGVQWVL